MDQPVTIQTVADRAGVSIGTVSRVLTNKSDVNTQTRRRVIDVIRETGFAPKVTSGSRNVIGLLMHPANFHLSLPFISQYLEGMFDAAFSHGYDLILIPVEWSETGTDEILLPVLQKGVKALLIHQPMTELGALDVFRSFELPIVVFQGNGDGPAVGWVNYDCYDIMYRALSTMYEYGYRRLWLVGRAAAHNFSVQERIRAFRDFGEHADVEAEFISRSRMTEDMMVQEFAGRLCEADAVPVGMTGTNSDFVPALYRALSLTGVDPVGSVGIVGVDNEHYYPYLDPPVSTIVHPVEEMGRKAVELAIGMINGQEARGIMLDSELVLRKSLSPALPVADAQS